EAARWSALLWLANWCEVSSGTVKEASMLAISLNVAGGLSWLMARQARVLKWRVGLLQGCLGLAFILLTAPWWMSFSSTIASGWTFYQRLHAGRVAVSWMAGMFDGMLFSELLPHRQVFCPSANFLLLLGVL